MTLHLIVVDGPEPAVPPEPWVRLTDLVREAAALVTDEGAVLHDAGEALPDGMKPSAVLYEGQLWPLAPDDNGPPTARVALSLADDRVVSVLPNPPLGHDQLNLSAVDRDGSVLALAAWLRSHLFAGITDDERRKLEAIIGEVARLLDSGQLDDRHPDDLAQTQVAIDTVTVQLRAPRPSRGVLGWALSQLPGFVIGSMSGVTGNYITEFLHHLS